MLRSASYLWGDIDVGGTATPMHTEIPPRSPAWLHVTHAGGHAGAPRSCTDGAGRKATLKRHHASRGTPLWVHHASPSSARIPRHLVIDNLLRRVHHLLPPCHLHRNHPWSRPISTRLWTCRSSPTGGPLPGSRRMPLRPIPLSITRIHRLTPEK